MSDAKWDAALSWLRAHLDDDERIAMEAGRHHGDPRSQDGHWCAHDDGAHLVARTGAAVGSFQWRGALDHAAMHDPDRVLRRVEGDRRILALFDDVRSRASHDAESEAQFYVLVEVMKSVALRFAGFPDCPEVLRLDRAAT